jgi:hypothetical protein
MPTQARYYSSTAAKTTLAASISSSAASLTLAAASNLPSEYPYTLILEKDTANEEVVEVTSLIGSAYQINRGIDSSGAKAHAFGANVEHGVSARDFTESRQHEVATSGHHGVTGNIVGTGGAQTLTSKTLTTPIIAGATISGAFTSTATITGGTITGATITGLSTPTNTSDAATKGYIDTQTVSAAASASSASVSASSAATSASSAATSASSALTSQTSAATSATSAATSASSSLTSQTSAATSASSASASATAASTSATSAATSASSAVTSASSALTSQTSAATSASSASASATAASTSASSAATSATSAATSATSAGTSASASATSAGQAATSATSAATSATSAAASATAAATSATSAGASATTASNSATTATTQATNAATSAASAATSASSAETSATAAASSATSAASSYDSFDDRYLGAKASAPSVDNDGNALITGALYWNTAVNKMYVWSGSAWTEISSSADIIAYKYTATAGATSVSGADDNSLTLSYTVGKEQVYINGVLQVRGTDYVATTGSSITGMAALTVSDIVTVLAFTAFSVSNTYTQAEANALFIPDAIVDAKGDLIVATAADTVARLAAGTNGDSLFADSSTATGLRWQGSVTGGKNFAINGGMDIWQRGTSFAVGGAGANFYSADRWTCYSQGAGTISQDTSLSASGFRYGVKFTSSAASGGNDFYQLVETDQTVPLAGKQVAVSGYCLAPNGKTPLMNLEYSTTVNDGLFGSYVQCAATTISQPTATGSLLRYTYSFAVPSTAKTLRLRASTGTLNNTEATIWTGIQVEVGNVPTAFSRAGGTIQGELAACQRYYYRFTATGVVAFFGTATNPSTTQGNAWVQHPVTMRVMPTSVDSASLCIREASGTRRSMSSIILETGGTNTNLAFIYGTISGGTVNIPAQLTADNTTAGYIGFSAEL